MHYRLSDNKGYVVISNSSNDVDLEWDLIGDVEEDDYDEYNGPCHPICMGCYGRSAYDCEECVEHSHLEDDTCVCDEDWGGEDCSIYKS